jgi:ACS family sodium-dependent inorganic phosphate cotransporter
MGMGEALAFPSIYSMYARWIPTTERSRAIGLTTSAIPLGTVVALATTPVVVGTVGWQWAFYGFGLAGIAWCVPWLLFVHSLPDEHPRISPKELELIRSGAGAENTARVVPWKALLQNSAVWAIIVAHFCMNWSQFVLLVWLPTFVVQGLGVEFASAGLFSLIPHAMTFIFFNVAGQIADRVILHGADVTRVRKVMQTIAFAGIASALMLVGLTDDPWVAITIMAIGSMFGGFVMGGFSVNHLDVAPRHAGTLMGLSNTAGTIPGIIGVFISGLVLELTGSWALVFQIAAGVTLVGLTFYLSFASGERQVA